MAEFGTPLESEKERANDAASSLQHRTTAVLDTKKIYRLQVSWQEGIKDIREHGPELFLS